MKHIWFIPFCFQFPILPTLPYLHAELHHNLHQTVNIIILKTCISGIWNWNIYIQSSLSWFQIHHQILLWCANMFETKQIYKLMQMFSLSQIKIKWILQEQYCTVTPSYSLNSEDSAYPETSIRLPDGNMIVMGKETFMAPEIMFQVWNIFLIWEQNNVSDTKCPKWPLQIFFPNWVLLKQTRFCWHFLKYPSLHSCLSAL